MENTPEIYMDDMIVKSKEYVDHTTHFKEVSNKSKNIICVSTIKKCIVWNPHE